MKGIYNRIKSVLADKHVTNKQLAKELGVTEKTVSQWCTNDAQPSIMMLFKIAKFLNVNVRDLLVPTVPVMEEA